MEKEERYRLIWVGLSITTIIVGLMWSYAMMSIGVACLIANAVLHKNVLAHFKGFFKNPILLAIASLFFVYALSGLWSANTKYWIDRVWMKMPFLALPIAFVAIPRLSQSWYLGLYYIFILGLTGIALVVTVNYLIADDTQHTYSIGQVLNTPVPHIRFSLMIAFATLAAFHIGITRNIIKYKWEAMISLGIGIFLTAFLHVLAVRSGLLVFYVGIFLLVMYHSYRTKKYWLMALVIGFIVLAPVLAYQFVDSFKHKIHYFQYDLSHKSDVKDIGNYSDTKRLTSIKAGVKVILGQPVLGTGIGDVLDETNAIYARDYPAVQAKWKLIPHNQYVFTTAATGLPGLLALLAALFAPTVWLWRNYKMNVLLCLLIIIIALSCMVESTLEVQLGISFYLIFLLIELNQTKGAIHA